MNRKLYFVFVFYSLALPVSSFSSATADSSVSFAGDIRPILSDKCFACHGPDEHAREAGLRLDIRAQAVDALAIVPGQADESELVRRILSEDPDEQMPPAHSNKSLSKAEIEIMRRWIDQGAEYQVHWAYRPLVRPEVPVIENTGANGAIDAFLLRQLSAQGLDFAPPADPVTLARRLYLDLLGVPPTPSELDEFLADDSAVAYQSLVDRLLKDERFGERMAVHWLDLVRYADTIGYHSDTFMEVSAYRDYVIDAFNHNQPFDQFTIEQLAGDLLPESTQSQRIASGYNRLLQTTEEGGAQAKEYIAIYAADRVRNVSGVWLGSTLGCAQCHDHKYDPFTMRDFYSLSAFFADIKETAVGKRTPNLKVYSDQDRQRIAELKAQIQSLQLPRLLETNTELAAALAAGQQAWETQALQVADQGQSIWQAAAAKSVEATGEVVLAAQDDGSYLATKGNPERGTYTYRIKTDQPVHAIRLEVLSDPSFPNRGFARGNGNIVLTGLNVSHGDEKIQLASAAADYEQTSWPIADTLDEKKQTGWAIDGHLKTAEKRVAVFYPAQPIEVDENRDIIIRMSHDSAHPQHLIGRFRILISSDPAAGLEGSLPLPDEVLAALRTSTPQRDSQQQALITEYYRKIAAELEPWKQKLAAAEKSLADYESSVRTMLVTESLDQPRVTRILPRGNWLDDSGEVVQPAVPAFLASSEIEGRRANRLDLAQWIVRPDNPLTSRTFVNRLWKLYFGRGLSRNLDDLGGQGSPPTHPQLLDWMAVEFRDSGWDVKHMVRLIVTSSAYTQSSVAEPRRRQFDPNNQWIARQGRWRLEAEFVRDSLLSVSGLLSDHVGGRSVKPYQPAGYWQHLNFPKRSWQADAGDRLYRRSLYTFWCRTFLHPAMLAFDATSREECTAQRSQSNIPQQALVLLNDPTYVEASRAFADRILQSAPSAPERIDWAFQAALSRRPDDAERKLLVDLYQQQYQRYQADHEQAKRLVSVGQLPRNDDADLAALAAWTQVARAIFNMYETTSRF